MYKIRAFRAIDDLESCKRFADGHKNVLLDYGITKVTTAKTEWFFNPGVYVMVVESEDGKEMLGGERIHLADGINKLPIEDALSVVDKRIFELVKKYSSVKTGELCGLWNSRSIAGKGVSILLTKVGVALARILQMDSLFVLCAPYTVEMCQRAGFRIEATIGDNGTFIYPNRDLIATALTISDIKDLSAADRAFKKRIWNIAEHPVQRSVETGPKGNFEVDFNLKIK